MSQQTWQRLVLAITVSFGIVCVSLVVVGVSRLVPAALTSAADLLPAEETVLVIADADEEALQSWRTWLPMPASFPTQTGATMALLAMNDQQLWVTMIPAPGSDPPFDIVAATPEAKALVGYGTNRLSDKVAYARLRSATHEPRAWWSAELLEDRPAIPSSVTRAVEAGAVSRINGETIIDILPHRALSGGNGVPALLNGNLSMAAGNAATLINGFDMIMPKDVSLPVRGLLHRRLGDITGEAVSPGFDLLPLLDGPASLAIARTGSGTVWTLSGEHDEAAEQIMDIYERARLSGGGIVIDRRTIEGFELNEVREGASAFTEEEIRQGMWSGRIATDGRRTVCAAINGDRYVLSTGADACRAAMTDGGSAGDPATVAAGSIDGPLLTELKALQLPGFAGSLIQTAPDRGIRWSAEIRNGALRLHTRSL